LADFGRFWQILYILTLEVTFSTKCTKLHIIEKVEKSPAILADFGRFWPILADFPDSEF